MEFLTIPIVAAVAELAGYLWHRYCAHNDLTLTSLRKSHQHHHRSELDDDGIDDFIWLLFFYFIFAISIVMLTVMGYVPVNFGFILIFTVLAVYILNLYLHSAYHQKDHPLNQYNWFKELKATHFLHHKYPDKNYGISNGLFDRLFSSYTDK